MSISPWGQERAPRPTRAGGDAAATSRLRRRGRPIRCAGLWALLSVLATACLPPGVHDPTGTVPIGNLEAFYAEGDGIRVQGWVADPNTWAPIELSVAIAGETRKVTADRHRADVGAVHPQLGPNHGFDYRWGGLGEGKHQICVWAENVGPGSQGRLLGCPDVWVGRVQPAGSLESAISPAPGVLRVSGWAWDPERPGPAEVAITLDGNFAVRRTTDVVRTDIGAFLRHDPRLGFSMDLPVSAGNHRVCAVAKNAGWGSDVEVGCAFVAVGSPPASRRPSGAITSVVPISGGVRLTGLASDPDGPVTTARIAVTGGSTVTAAVAGGAFSRDLTGLAPGPAEVCVTLLDVIGSPGPSGDTTLPCASAVVGGSVSVGSGGSPNSSTVVGPAPGSPLSGIDRDAGISVTLRDGSVLWLFADSSAVDAEGDPRYFLNNTAAWAAPGSPTVTRDAVAPGARPVQFASPGPGFPPCPPSLPTAAMWPMSAVAVPDGPRDRVIVMMGNVCVGDQFMEMQGMGVSVVQWVYDPSSPPAGTPVTATVLNQQLFGASDLHWGNASVLGPNNQVYAYACQTPPGGGWFDQYGPCKVARVAAGSVADRSAWRFWAGANSWVADVGSAAAMVLTAGPGGAEVPVASMSVTYDADSGAWVMAYSPWPGFTDRIHVRVATSPNGPWTAPVVVHLPGCNETIAGVGYYCYAGTRQPSLDRPGLLGLGYYDQMIQVGGPSSGGYLAVTVPFSIVVAP